jgi:endo-1,3-1,4-beta-glycanase ExoK
MATRSSSRATIPTDRREPTKIRGITAVALALMTVSGTSACAQAAPARNSQAKNSDSFFDPFNKTDGRRWYISNGWSNGAIQGCTWDISRLRTNDGILELSVGPAGAANPGCAEIRTNARLGYGTYEARIKTASGNGFNTAMFTYSGAPLTSVHDEIDFEFLGKAPGQVQLNYFTNGRGGHETFPILAHDASGSFQTIAFEWLPESIRWFIDGKLVREERRAGLPYTPGQFFLSLWSAGPAGTGWLGQVDKSRLPAKAYIDWIAFTRMDEKCLFPESITCR